MRSTFAAGLLLGTSVILAACGGTSASAPAAPTAPPATAAPAATEIPAATGEPTAGGAAAVNLADTSLGSVLVDGDGRTLYMFTADSAGTSSCYDSCATNWPPVLGTATPGAGLDAALFATTDRTDGTAQVTFNGMPLYLFAGDSKPGDVNGQGVGGKWFVLGADGKPVK